MAFLTDRQSLAILWAQWRSLANFRSRSRRRFPIAGIFALLWYGLWTFLAFSVCRVTSEPANVQLLEEAGPMSLLLVFVYWQLVPIIMVSAGLSLDLQRLIPYPIDHLQLFRMEVLLRTTTSGEMLLIIAGAMAGLLLNPVIPLWAPFALVLFSVFNLLVSAGLRDLINRLLARKGFREVMVLAVVLLAALPQALLTSEPPEQLRSAIQPLLGSYLAWGACARLAIGHFDWLPSVALCIWTGAAWYFGRSQFERGLRFDAAEARSQDSGSGSPWGLLEALSRLPRTLFKDPLAALVEKEIRIYCRSARFRLLFIMGFTFGLIIWLPLAIHGDEGSVFRTNYLPVVSAYAMMLLGEICFWNNFGMDRSAAQTYFVMPLRLSTVLLAKNLTASLFIFSEILLVAICSAILQMPITLGNIVEALSITLVLTVLLLAMGNMMSTRYPRPLDPAQSWRTGSTSRVQAYLLFLYPVASVPVFLAYSARYAFESEWAFYAVLLLGLKIGIVVYVIAMESAVAAARRNKEDLIMTLSAAEGPIAT